MASSATGISNPVRGPESGTTVKGIPEICKRWDAQVRDLESIVRGDSKFNEYNWDALETLGSQVVVSGCVQYYGLERIKRWEGLAKDICQSELAEAYDMEYTTKLLEKAGIFIEGEQQKQAVGST